MFYIDDDMTIYVTRGDVACFSVTADNNGEEHIFRKGDVIRIKVTKKKDCNTVVLQKDFPVTKDSTRVDIILTEEETTIGDVISKPVDYWYEVELNPYTSPQTIIGYDDDGAKIFKVFPEGRELLKKTEVEDVPVVDAELSLTSTRPLENQAVTRAFIEIAGLIEDAESLNGSAIEEAKKQVSDVVKDISKYVEYSDTEHAKTRKLIETEVSETRNLIETEIAETQKKIKDTKAATDEDIAKTHEMINVERQRISNMASLTEGSTTGDAELIDARIAPDGVKHTNLGESIRTQMEAKQDALGTYVQAEYELIKDKNIHVGYDSQQSYEGFECIDYTLQGEQLLMLSGSSNSTSEYYPFATFLDAEKNIISKIGDGKPFAPYTDYPVVVPKNAVRLIVNGKTWDSPAVIKKHIPKDLVEIEEKIDNIYPEQMVGCVEVEEVKYVEVATEANSEYLAKKVYNKDGEMYNSDVFSTIIYPIKGIWHFINLYQAPSGSDGGCFLDAEKKFISSFSNAYEDNSYIQRKEVPRKAKYIALTRPKDQIPATINIVSMSYKFAGLKAYQSDIIPNANPLYGKKVVWIGTSVPYGAAGVTTSYALEVANKLGFNLVNCSTPGVSIHTDASGKPLTHGSIASTKAEYAENGKVIEDAPIEWTPSGNINNYYRTYENIFCEANADADLYVFDVVPNNANFNTSDWDAFDFENWQYKDGSTFESHRTTFYGALLFLMDKMYALNENARMVFILGSSFQYAEGKEAFAKLKEQWNIPCLDLWGKINTSPRSLPKLLAQNGTDPHPSTHAHQIMGRMLANDLMSVY